MNMLVTIVVIWVAVIPAVVLAISWRASDRPEPRGAQTNDSVRAGKRPTGVLPRARRVALLSRVTARRVCQELEGDARRRRTSA